MEMPLLILKTIKGYQLLWEMHPPLITLKNKVHLPTFLTFRVEVVKEPCS